MVGEFTRQAPGRRAARLLLATGPVAGGCWAAALILGRAWTWPVPATARIGFAAVLLLAVLALLAAATSRHSYQRTRLAAARQPGHPASWTRQQSPPPRSPRRPSRPRWAPPWPSASGGSRSPPGCCPASPPASCPLWTCGVWRGRNERTSRRFSRRCRRSSGRRRRCARPGGCVTWSRTSSATTTWARGPARARGPGPVPARPYQRRRAGAIRHAQPGAAAGAAGRSPAAPGVPAALGGRAGLVETLIHHQDIRRGLARPRPVPAERLLPALRTALIAPDIRGLWRIRGLRLVATDLRFSAGVGPEVRGAAEALLMAIAGRRGVVERTVRTRPGKACRPHRRPMTTSAPQPMHTRRT